MDPTAPACLAGRCVPDECSEETPELCTMPACEETSDCMSAGEPPCVALECTMSGACFASPVHETCLAGEECSVTAGCVAVTGAGTLDESFGSDGTGIVRVEGPGDDDELRAVVVDEMDRIVVAGRSNDMGMVARFLPDGTLDRTFESAGFSFLTVGTARVTFHAIALAADGSIVAGGEANRDGSVTAFVARLTPDGSPDVTFGGVGFVEPTFPSRDLHHVRALDIIEPEGDIVMAGAASGPSGTTTAFWRLTSTGGPDTMFGTGGTSEESATLTTEPQQSAFSLSARSSGGFVTIGTATYSARATGRSHFEVTSTGTVFGGSVGGVASRAGRFVSVLPSDMAVAIEFSGPRPSVGRFRFSRFVTGGTDEDPTFGPTLVSFTGGDDELRVLGGMVQEDGSCVGIGSHQGPLDQDLALARVDSNGLVDASFGEGGITSIDLGGDDIAHDGAQGVGRLIVVGRSDGAAVVLGITQ